MLTEAYPRKATRADLLKLNPVIPAGDTVTEEDTGQMKVGNGRHRWSQLPYVTPRPLAKADIENLIYDKAYSWELQPGSDVMATCVSVLPKIGTLDNGSVVYAGLVTITDNLMPPGQWYFAPATTALTLSAVDAATSGDPVSAGVHLAAWYTNPGEPPPYAFPEGWTPGNTTGEGPVMPKVGTESGKGLYGGLAIVDHALTYVETHPTGSNEWYIIPVGSGDSYYEYMNASAYAAEGDPAGLYILVAKMDDDPTTLPTGWTFRPYGIGPVAMTDENAGGLIGDVAYVVSGYVYNTNESGMLAIYEPRWIGLLPIGDHVVSVGDVFGSAQFPHDSKHVVTHAGTVTEAQGVSPTSSNGATWSSYETVAPSYWPFIERYDLAAKKWLPRIPLPLVDETHPYASEGSIAGVIDGKLYFGGGDGDNITGQEFFVFDPATDLITRLADFPDGDHQDYTPYGVVGGKLWSFNADGVCYDPVAGIWSQHAITGITDFGNQTIADQVTGFTIGGKLWFVYDGAAFVFDPEALTVTAKAAQPNEPAGSPFLLDGKIVQFMNQTLQGSGHPSATYDSIADTWTERTDQVVEIPTNYDSEFVGVTYQGTPFLLSGTEAITSTFNHPHVLGVYGMTGVALDKPQPQRLDEADDAEALVPLSTALAAVQAAEGVFVNVNSGFGGASFPLISTDSGHSWTGVGRIRVEENGIIEAVFGGKPFEPARLVVLAVYKVNVDGTNSNLYDAYYCVVNDKQLQGFNSGNNIFFDATSTDYNLGFALEAATFDVYINIPAL